MAAGVLAALVAGSSALGAAARRFDEDAVKAAFLFHFTRFVEWPPDAYGSSDDPFRICLAGDPPLAEPLAEIVGGESVGSRRLVVVDVQAVEDIAACQLLFSPAGTEDSWLDELPAPARGRILTVGETPEFLERGGLVRLRLVGDRLRLEINDEARGRSRLRFSAKLLQVSRIVEPAAEPAASRERSR